MTPIERLIKVRLRGACTGLVRTLSCISARCFGRKIPVRSLTQIVAVFAAFCFSTVSLAADVYIADKVWVGLRAEKSVGSPIVKVLKTGDRLQLLKHSGDLALVRDGDGEEGWVAQEYIMTLEPAAIRLGHAELQLTQVRDELTETKRRLQALFDGQETSPRELNSSGRHGPTGTDYASVALSSPTGVFVIVAISGLLLVFGFFGGVLAMRAKFRNRFPENLL